MPRTGGARVLLFAFLGEGALGLAALLWVLVRGLPITWGEPVRAVSTGVAVALLLAAVQYGLLHHAPAIGPVEALRRLYGELLFPLFHRVTPAEIIGISLLAGVGEELFFRGAMQQEWGWTAASVVFGLCHVGNRDTLILGVWAGLVGGILGWLAMVTGGLLAPIVAHALYDALALSYIRWGFVPHLDRDSRDGHGSGDGDGDGDSGGRTSL
jgi:membrane protease YdiL (CAAX protease family)